MFGDQWLTWIDLNPDFSDSDLKTEVEKLKIRETLIANFLNGAEHHDVVCDAIEQHGLSAHDWSSHAVAETERFASDGFMFADHGKGLILPEGLIL